jgi:adhesin transport system membrane fusion protein
MARRSADSEHRINFTLWITILALAVFFIWANYSELDTITRGQGAVIANSKTQSIQSFDGGVIENIHVKEGDTVQRNQILVTLEKIKIEAAFREQRSKVAALRAAKARLNAEIFGGQPKFDDDIKDYPQFKINQLKLLERKRSMIKEQIDALELSLRIVKKQLQMTKALVPTGDVSLMEALKLQNQVSDMSAQIENTKNKYFQDTQTELNKIEEDLSASLQTLALRQDQLDHVVLRSPTNGIVKNIRITTLGGVVKPSEEVMQIVPAEDDLVIEAKIKPSDIAFLRKGQNANIKIDAYDYSIYGSLEGKLIYISADTLTEEAKQNEPSYYRIKVQTQGRQFSGRPQEKIEIQTGMTAIVEIKTGKNNVLKYLFKPLIKTIDSSLTER